jgi:hypothetical protein
MRADIHGGPEQKLQSEAGYIDARPQTDSSTKTSCNARPDHTFGSEAVIRALAKLYYWAFRNIVLIWVSSRSIKSRIIVLESFEWRLVGATGAERPYARICHAVSIDQLPPRSYLHCIINVGGRR